MTVRIELQCDVCRTAYIKTLTSDVTVAREAAEKARWSRSIRHGTLTDICPRCTPPAVAQ